MKHPLALAALLLGCLTLLAVACSDRARPHIAPNVLLIVADDLGYNDLAINNGNSTLPTPELDALAQQGIRFTRHYADTVCSPSRAALLSGQHPVRLGFEPNGRGLSPQVLTLAEALRERGYRTWHIGKWHIGDTVREAWPDRQGFEHWFGFLNQWLLAGPHEESNLQASHPRHENPWLMSDGAAAMEHQGHLDDILTDKAIATLQELAAHEAPWFINLWLYAPHAPITPAQAFAARQPDTAAGRYTALVQQLDHNVGRLLRALEQSGDASSTLVVFVSDNGGTNRELDNNFPFSGKKSTFHEGGVRTPLIIRRPAETQPGRIRDDSVAIYDLFPTILEFAGVPTPPGIDGRDLFNATPAPPRQLVWESFHAGHHGYSVLLDDRWRYYKPWPWLPWESTASLVDLHTRHGTGEDLAAAEPALAQKAHETWKDWHRSVHQPEVRLQRASDGRIRLEGMDFLRTPGFGAFSFGIAFRDIFQGELARQPDTWSLAVDGSRLHADFQHWQLRAELPAGDCNSVLISAHFARQLSNTNAPPDSATLTLYVNGRLADSVSGPGTLDASHFAEPTWIGNGSGLAGGGTLSPPLLLSAVVEQSEVWDPATIHRELCAQLPQDQVDRPVE